MCVVKSLKDWEVLDYKGEESIIAESDIEYKMKELVVPRTIRVGGLEVIAPDVTKFRRRRTKSEVIDAQNTRGSNKYHDFKSEDWEGNFYVVSGNP